VNKGDEQEPTHRSRLVARQLKALDNSGDSFFAPAPPLEALRSVLSRAMTKTSGHSPDWSPTPKTHTQLSVVDVGEAYLNAEVDQGLRPTFVELPSEDKDYQRLCGQLLRHMYGTRMAADGWQEEYGIMLLSFGFKQGQSCPNAPCHPGRAIVTSVHGVTLRRQDPRAHLIGSNRPLVKPTNLTLVRTSGQAKRTRQRIDQ
jgi:hypothetical protein